MEWYQYVAIGLIAIVASMALLNLMKRYRALKAVDMVRRKVLPFVRGETLKIHKLEHIYQLEFIGQHNFLIKVIDMNPYHEVIITNADKVVINDDIRNWKRSSKPHFVPLVREFIKLQPEHERTVKMVVIYPDCHNITKYINESDCHLLDKFKKMDGLYFIKYNDLEEFLNLQ